MTLGPQQFDTTADLLSAIAQELRFQKRRGARSGDIPIGLLVGNVAPEAMIDGSTGGTVVPGYEPNSSLEPQQWVAPTVGPPPAPSPPTTMVRLGTVTVCWDGLTIGDVLMPIDVDHIDVHRSTEPGFEPSDATVYDSLGTAGCVVITGQEYGSTWYYRLVAVGRNGLWSESSPETSATTIALVDTDIIGKVLSGSKFIDGTIDTAALADGSVSASKIAAGAITEDKLGFTIEAGGITATFAPTAPATPALGDLWYDQDDNWHPYQWNGTAWVSFRDGAIDQARLDAIAAAATDATTKANQAKADAISAAALDAQQKADLAEAAALADANSYTDTKVLTAANGKNKIYFATTAPTGGTYLTDDVWFDIDNGYALSRWSGSAWVPAALGPDAIAANAITETKIATDAITTPKIAAGAITAAEIAANTITAGQIAADTITATQIAAGAITASELAAGSVIAGKLAADSVLAANIKAGEIAAGHIAANTITAAQIATGAITADELAANSVIAGKIAALAVEAGDIAANAITAGTIAADAVTSGTIAAGAITTAKLAVGAVTADIIAAGAVGADELAANSVIAGKIAANAVTAGTVAALAIEAGDIAANAVTADTVAAGAITAEKISLGVIRTNLVADASFEDDYAFGQWDLYGAGGPGDTAQWRKMSGAPVRFVGDGRSGATSAHLPAAAGQEASLMTASFPVISGKKYKILVHATALESTAILALQFGHAATPGAVEFVGSWTINGLGEWAAGFVPAVAAVTSDSYQVFAGEVTALATEWAALRVMQWNPSAQSTLVVDDISVVEMGQGGASELTAAGLRLFDNDGDEVGAFVSNRPNFFSVTREVSPGVYDTVASISRTGYIDGTGISTDTDPIIGGFPLLGTTRTWQSPHTSGGRVEGHLDKLPRGVIAYDEVGPGSLSGTSWRRELSFLAEPGRSYKLCISSTALTLANGTDNYAGFYIGIATPASVGGDASGVTFAVKRYSYTGENNGQLGGVGTATWIARANQGGTSQGGEINYGRNRMAVGFASSSGATSHEGYQYWVEDIGPDMPATGIAAVGTTAQSSATQTYTQTWRCNGAGDGDSAAYQQGGTKETWSSDLQHGYLTAPDGNQYSVVVFGNGSRGETIATAMTGATLVKAEAFFHFKWWYDNAGGTATIRANNLTALPATGTTPSGAAITSSGWPKPGGRWIDITPIWNTSQRGLWLGPGASNSLDFTGRAASHLDPADLRPQLRLTYRK